MCHLGQVISKASSEEQDIWPGVLVINWNNSQDGTKILFFEQRVTGEKLLPRFVESSEESVLTTSRDKHIVWRNADLSGIDHQPHRTRLAASSISN